VTLTPHHLLVPWSIKSRATPPMGRTACTRVRFILIMATLTEADRELKLRRLKDLIISWPRVSAKKLQKSRKNFIQTAIKLIRQE